MLESNFDVPPALGMTLFGVEEHFLDKIKTNEEMFALWMNERDGTDRSFEEYAKIYAEDFFGGVVYSNLKDMSLLGYRMSEEEFQLELERIKEEFNETFQPENAEITLIDQNGEEVWIYDFDDTETEMIDVPYEQGTYIFTTIVKFANGMSKEYQFKTIIDRYEVVGNTSHDNAVFVLDLVGQKCMTINSAKYADVDGTNENEINTEDIKQEEGCSYFSAPVIDRRYW